MIIIDQLENAEEIRQLRTVESKAWHAMQANGLDDHSAARRALNAAIERGVGRKIESGEQIVWRAV